MPLGLIIGYLLTDSYFDRAGKRVFAWTVNDRQTMEKMLSAGVDGIVTADPALLQEVMRDREHECYAEGFSP
jgi:glycerophosphoryl diester phosphodiesterase